MVEAADRIVMRGSIEVARYRASDGKLLDYQQSQNAVATLGRAWVLQALLSGEGQTSQVLQQLALGTDTTAPATGDTGLGSELARKAVGTWDTSGLTANPPWFRALVQFETNEANGTLAECGLFNSSAGSTMLAHATFGTIDKQSSNTLGVTYTISN